MEVKGLRTILIVHALFWLLLIASAACDVSLTMFGMLVPAAVPLIAVSVPFLVLASWRPAKDATYPRLKNYFKGFLWLGTMLWVTNLILLAEVFTAYRRGP